MALWIEKGRGKGNGCRSKLERGPGSAFYAYMRFYLLLFLLSISGCNLPRDTDGTLARVQRGTLRVGVIEGARTADHERALVHDLAQQLAAQEAWTNGQESELIKQLHDRELDLVIGSLTDDLPWAEQVAFTRPVREDTLRYVWAVPPGENAWLVRVERFIEARRN
jgi:hypothetical protein